MENRKFFENTTLLSKNTTEEVEIGGEQESIALLVFLIIGGVLLVIGLFAMAVFIDCRQIKRDLEMRRNPLTPFLAKEDNTPIVDEATLPSETTPPMANFQIFENDTGARNVFL